MEQKSQILEVEVDHGGKHHRATYFVEEGTIHTAIEGRVVTIPLGPRPAAETVKAVLSGYLLQQSRKLQHNALWRGA